MGGGWWQVQGIQGTLESMLGDLMNCHDAFAILWWRVLTGACRGFKLLEFRV